MVCNCAAWYSVESRGVTIHDPAECARIDIIPQRTKHLVGILKLCPIALLARMLGVFPVPATAAQCFERDRRVRHPRVELAHQRLLAGDRQLLRIIDPVRQVAIERAVNG